MLTHGVTRVMLGPILGLQGLRQCQAFPQIATWPSHGRDQGLVMGVSPLRPSHGNRPGLGHRAS
jgi:hypothetical protein